jgi:hypothetical protein
VTLPATNRQRLVWLLSHLLARQLVAPGARREDSHDAARPG